MPMIPANHIIVAVASRGRDVQGIGQSAVGEDASIQVSACQSAHGFGDRVDIGLNRGQGLTNALGDGRRRDLNLLHDNRGNHPDTMLAVEHCQQLFHNSFAIGGLAWRQAAKNTGFEINRLYVHALTTIPMTRPS